MLSKMARVHALRAKTLQSKTVFSGAAKRFKSEVVAS